jgi:hypothetical protein
MIPGIMGHPERAFIGPRLADLLGEFALGKIRDGFPMIPHVPKCPGTAVEYSRRWIPEDRLEVVLREIAQGGSDIGQRPVGHYMSKEQLHILYGILLRLEPYDSLGNS